MGMTIDEAAETSGIGRIQPKGRDVLMYRMIQSFKPREVTPEQAHEIACELAMKFTDGRHPFAAAAHTDKAHIHSHIEFNSVNPDCDRKFTDFLDNLFGFYRSVQLRDQTVQLR